jgi:Carboxypeptidase regulatory-like domain
MATLIIEPVVTTFIDPGLNYIGFQGDFTFDSSVVTFDTAASGPTQPAGVTATNWNVSAAILNSGPGAIKTLRISAFSQDQTPLNGSGTLFNLRMHRLSSTPGATSPLVWQPAPDNFIFLGADFNTHAPASTPSGLITIGEPVTLSGTISYCSNPAPGPVAGVTVTLTGSASASTVSDSSGNYSFTGLPTGGNYTVTLTKAGRGPGAGINTLDAIAVQKHFLGSSVLPPGCRRTAANSNGDAGVDTRDVNAIQRFFLGQTGGIGHTGQYQFNPASRTYSGVISNQTGQNYDTLILGDVTSPFVSPP